MLITCITAFNGLNLLPKCAENFLKFSDKVLICYQDISHKGEVRDVGTFVKTLASDRVIISEFVPKLKDDQGRPLNRDNTMFKRNERLKHNQMIAEARELGATYYILSAVDHFYFDDEVKASLEEAKKYDVTFTRLQTYYKDPTWQVTPPVDYIMPFICKMRPESRIGMGKYPELVDEALKVFPIESYKIFDSFYCHNYSTIGRFEKFDSHHISLLRTKKRQKELTEEYETFDINKNDGVQYYKGKKINIVPNYFGLPTLKQ